MKEEIGEMKEEIGGMKRNATLSSLSTNY